MNSTLSRFAQIAQLLLLTLLAVVSAQPATAQNNALKTEKDSQVRDFYGSDRTITINRAGNYRLRDDLRVRNNDGIIITASNVTLNLDGNTVSTDAGGTGRGIFINGASGVEVSNGKINGFNADVSVADSVNVNIHNLQIVGRGLAPNNGPTEIGILLLNTRNASVRENNVSSVNLGIFVRGGNSTGNRLFENIIVGGATPANNLLGICYNPASGSGADPNNPGPRGDNIYNNHIARFNFALAISAGSIHNIFNENTAASFTGSFREPDALTTGGGTNISEGNLSVILPATILPTP